MEMLIYLILCHLIGDYLFQTDFIAKTKGSNWYHMFVHCGLYIAPFAFFFGITWQLSILFATHMIIDPLKARYNKINYWQDQVLHYLLLLLYLI